jgi:hypothetical protein
MRPLFCSAIAWLVLCTLAQAQCPNEGALVQRFVTLSRKYVSVLDSSKQSEAPSITDNSTTLANTSGASDTATLSLSPSLTTTNSRSPKSTDIGTSFSLAALFAAVKAKNPLDPDYYASSRPLRRFSVSLTDSFPSGSATADQGSNSYGLKFVVNPRDSLSGKHTNQLCQFFSDADLQRSPAFKSALSRLAMFLYTASAVQLHTALGLDSQVMSSQQQFAEAMSTDTKALAEFISQAPQEIQPEISRLMEQAIPEILHQGLTDRSLSRAGKTLQALVNAPQFAVEYAARISKGLGANLYRTQLDYDQTFWKITGTTNAGFDFQNAQTQGAHNRSIGRVVEQLQYPVPWPVKQITLKVAASGEGDWGSNGTPIYKSQGKLTFGLFSGFDLPLSVTYVNRTAGVNRGDVKGQLGVAIDFTRLWVHPPKAVVF